MANNQNKKRSDEEVIEAVFEAVKSEIAPPPGSKEKVWAHLESRMAAKGHRPARRPRVMVAHNFLWWFTRISPVAAAILLVVAAGLWFSVGDVQQAYADFGQMLKNVRDANTVAYTVVVHNPGQPEYRADIVMAMRPDRARVTYSDGRISTVTPAAGGRMKITTLTPSIQTVREILYQEFIYWNPVRSLLELGQSDGKFVRNETLDGRDVLLYRVQKVGTVTDIWVDKVRELPVRIEVRDLNEERGTRVVLGDIRWELSVDNSLFTLAVPPGYRLEAVGSDANEASLIETLRICAAWGDGVFPDKLDRLTASRLFLKGVSSRENVIENEDGAIMMVSREDEERNSNFRTCLRGLAFVKRIRTEGNWWYVGKDVRLGDAMAPVCGWKPTGSKDYRIIYGDLHMENVPQDNLPAVFRKN